MVFDQFRNLQGGGDFPRDGGAVDHAFGQAFGDGRNRHTDRGCAQLGQQRVDRAGAATDLHALQVACGFNRVGGVDHAGAVDPGAQDVDVLELGVLHVTLKHFPIGVRGRASVGHHEREFEDFGRRIAARRVADHGPDDVGNAVDGLVHQLWRLAAQLHRRITVDLDAAIGRRLDIVGPDIQDQLRHICLRWQELVELQRHLLSEGGRGAHRGNRRRACCAKNLSASGHVIPPFDPISKQHNAGN